MSTGAPKKTVTLDEARLERVTEAIAFASAGAYEAAVERLSAAEEDGFGVIEEALRILLTELAEANEKSALAYENLARAKQELEDKVETIERQRDAIRELSVPIIDVWDDVITLPLVGTFDTSRAVDVTEKLLRRVADTRVRWVILDLTGVVLVDTATAQHLLRISKAVRLLGARCILTGINEQIAATLAALGISLDELNPMRTLRQGLKHCLAQRAAERRLR